MILTFNTKPINSALVFLSCYLSLGISPLPIFLHIILLKKSINWFSILSGNLRAGFVCL